MLTSIALERDGPSRETSDCRAPPRTKPPHKPAVPADFVPDNPANIKELGDVPTSTLYHYLAADGTLKDPGRRLLEA